MRRCLQPSRALAIHRTFTDTDGNGIPNNKPGVTDGGGGGGGPEWLPAGALAFADFVNGHYYAGGAETTAAAMFGEDTAFGAFDLSTALQPGVGLSGSPTLIGAALASTVAGSTVLIAVNADVSGSHFCNIAFDLFDTPDYNFDVYGGGSQAQNVYLHASSVATSTQMLVNGINKIALTITPTNAALSANGETVVSADALAFSPAPTAFGFSIISTGGGASVFTALTIYPPQLDAALPALSAL